MRFLQFPELKQIKGIPFSRAHIWRMERAGMFPKRVNLAKRTVAWAESEIDDWIEGRFAKREADRWQKLGDAAERVVSSLKEEKP